MAAALISGCGSQSGKNSTETEDNSQEPSAAGNTEEPSAETASNGEATTLSLWLTEQLHVEFYDEMEKLWNEGNPNRQIELEYTVLPYEDMHSKLLIALTGYGAWQLKSCILRLRGQKSTPTKTGIIKSIMRLISFHILITAVCRRRVSR